MSLQDLAGMAEAYEGMLVCIEQVTVSNAAPEPGPGDGEADTLFEFEVQDPSGMASVRVKTFLSS